MTNIQWMLSFISAHFKWVKCLYISDYKFLMHKHKSKLRRNANFHNPETFNEKISHRMLYDNNPKYTQLADKVQARIYVANKIGSKYLVPLIGVYEKFSHIDFETFPTKFVIKCSHDCGSTLVCRNKNTMQQKEYRKKIILSMAGNLYYKGREKHYRDIHPRIICEHYLDLHEQNDKPFTLELARVHCFGGDPKYIEVDIVDNKGNDYVNLYDTEWTLQSVTIGRYPNLLSQNVAPPAPLNELLRLSKELTGSFDYCRLDWFIKEDSIFFSEFTFTPYRGHMIFTPQSFDKNFGDLWKQRNYRKK